MRRHRRTRTAARAAMLKQRRHTRVRYVGAHDRRRAVAERRRAAQRGACAEDPAQTKNKHCLATAAPAIACKRSRRTQQSRGRRYQPTTANEREQARSKEESKPSNFNRRDTVASGEGGANSMVAPTERINDGEGRRRSGKPFTRKIYRTLSKTRNTKVIFAGSLHRHYSPSLSTESLHRVT